jgi:hypothetical protein
MRPVGVVLDDLAPLADRLRLLVWLRLGLAAVVTAYAVAVPEGVPQADLLLRVTGGYVVLALLVHLLWQRSGRRGLCSSAHAAGGRALPRRRRPAGR